MPLPDIPKATADYINFIIDFGSSPTKALKSYKGKGSVSAELVTFSFLGALFTWLVLLLLKNIADAHRDNSYFLKLIGKGDIQTIPLLALATIVLFSIIVHLAMTLVLRFRNGKVSSDDPGNPEQISIDLKDTINGALAFFSFAPVTLSLSLLFAMMFLFTFVSANPSRNQAIAALVASVIPNVILCLALLLFYFPSALSGVQSVMKRSDAIAIFITIASVVMVGFWISSLF